MRDLNSYGIVGVVEPGIDERQMALYRAVHDAGEMTVRTDVLYRAMRKADVEKGIAAIKAQKNDDMLRFVGIKFPLDGGVEGGRMTLALSHRAGRADRMPDYRGVLLLPPGGEDEYVAGPEADRRGRVAGADPCGGRRDHRRDRARLRARQRASGRSATCAGPSCTCSILRTRRSRRWRRSASWRRCRIIPCCSATTSAAGGATSTRPMRFRSARRSTPACWSAAAPTGRSCRSIRSCRCGG